MGTHPPSLVSVARSLAEGWCAFVRGAVHGGAWELPGGCLGAGGEDFADMNWGYLVGPKGVEEATRVFVQELRARRLPGVLTAVSPAAAAVAPVAAALGLAASQPTPLMCVRAADARHVSSDFVVERVTEPASLLDAADVLGDAYDLPPEWCAAMLGPGFLEQVVANVFVARRDGRAVAVAGTAAVGGAVGLYAVGTRKAQRRRGAGSAVVSGAVDHHLRRGAHLLSLLAAPEAEGFYTDLGFGVVDRCPTWLVPRP